MSRYIDADALRHRVLYFADARNLNGNHEQAKAYNHCLCMIDEQKTADVQEVVHGEWKKMDKHGRNIQCSICGNTLNLHGVNAGRGDANFCPNCGADMRGGADDN